MVSWESNCFALLLAGHSGCDGPFCMGGLVKIGRVESRVMTYESSARA